MITTICLQGGIPARRICNALLSSEYESKRLGFAVTRGRGLRRLRVRVRVETPQVSPCVRGCAVAGDACSLAGISARLGYRCASLDRRRLLHHIACNRSRPRYQADEEAVACRQFTARAAGERSGLTAGELRTQRRIYHGRPVCPARHR